MISHLEGDEYCVFLRNIKLDLSIGIREKERVVPQPVVINVEIYLKDPGNFVSEDIADYLSYSDVFEQIKAIQTAGRHIELVENLAETIAAITLKYDGVQRARVSVEKPAIIPEAESVGVAIERRK